MEIPRPHRKHNLTEDGLGRFRLIVHLVAHPVGRTKLSGKGHPSGSFRCALLCHFIVVALLPICTPF